MFMQKTQQWNVFKSDKELNIDIKNSYMIGDELLIILLLKKQK